MIKYPLVGMSHRKPAATVLSFLPPGTKLRLVREPDNAHDPNAIQVWIDGAAGIIGQDGVEGVSADAAALEVQMPDLLSPFQLGYIKAASIDDTHFGADQLAPKLDGLIAEGQMSNYSEVPMVLFYGTSGRPHVVLAEEYEDAKEEEEGEQE